MELQRACPQTIYQVLEELNIPYKALEHEEAATMEDCKAIGEKLGAEFCKNLFLANRQQTEFYLLLIGEDKKFRTAEVSKKIGKARLSFGNEEKLYELLGVHPGSISPMGLIFDPQHTVHLLIDRDVAKLDSFCVHPCKNTASVAIGMKDFQEVFLQHTGHIPEYLEITGEVE
ncbi:prolyl-tRNA synthetase associated domain-containing protein [Acidaminobacterium chupaoyuni]